MLQLNALTYNGFCIIVFKETPNHSQRNVQGAPKIIKIAAMISTCEAQESDRTVNVTVAVTVSMTVKVTVTVTVIVTATQ